MFTLTGILSALAGLADPISKITAAISNEKIAALNATTEEERIAAQERVASLQVQRDALIADGRAASAMRFFIALGPAIYLNKIFIWDKVLGWGSTDELSAHLWWIAMVVVGFYFLHSILKK